MRFTLWAYENVSDNRFWDAKDGDTVERVAPVGKDGPDGRSFSTFIITTETVEDALETLWRIGNKEEPDLSDDFGQVWPRTRRSMSVGDIVNVEGVGTFKVANMGFESTGDAVFPVAN